MPFLIDRIQGASASLAFKAPCRVCSTGNLTLAGWQTIDGVLPSSTQHADLRRVLVRSQTAGSENGLYDMQSNAWTRAKDFDSVNDFRKGTRLYVADGSSGSGEYIVSNAMDPDNFRIDTDTITISTF